MCQVKNVPIESKYHSKRFGDRADQCMVGVINRLNADEEFATCTSCCGHGHHQKIPYVSMIMPPGRIKEVKCLLESELGWHDLLVSVFIDPPEDAKSQLGWKFMQDKVYVGFYSRAKNLNIQKTDRCLTWREDDLQVA